MKAALVVAAIMVAACGGGGNNTASHSPTQSNSPGREASAAPTSQPAATPSPSSPPPVTVPYGVLVGSQAANTYGVSLIAANGRVAATAQASTPVSVSCANTAAAVVPLPVSSSNSRVYFMDAKGAIHFLAPDGTTGQVTTVPAGTASQRSMFAVSPDDQRIAVVVDGYSPSGASTRVYVEDLSGGGHHLDIFSESGPRSLWPVGWHGTNNLVLAVVPACTQGGGPYCCGPIELHVVDPATANRRFTIGSGTCRIAGAASPAGVACVETGSYTTANVYSWTAGKLRSLAINGPAFVYVSPGGGMVAMVDNNGTSFTIGAASIAGMFACGWIDDTHVMSGGDAQHQPRIAQPVAGTIVPVAAEGDCGGRLPGGL